MWQTIVMLALLMAAVIFAARHFLRVVRTGSDCTCSGCGSSGCRGKPLDPEYRCGEDPSNEQ